MGSLTSRPKVPQRTAPQVVYVANPAPTPTPAPAPSVSRPVASGDGDNGESATAETRSENREKNLLSRSRGRQGTVQTSFRGLLSLANGESGRKTLLGE